MQCPVCKDSQLTMSDRQNVEIDYCPHAAEFGSTVASLTKLLSKASAT